MFKRITLMVGWAAAITAVIIGVAGWSVPAAWIAGGLAGGWWVWAVLADLPDGPS